MMYLICSASTCNSNHTTKVGSRSIKFYPYPNDEKLKDQWKKICKSTCTSSARKDLFRLCELHFKESSFTEDMKLKPDAVPTIFNFPTKWKKETKVYPPAKKRKPENQDDKNDRKKQRKVYPPAKRRKPENQDDKNDTDTSLYHPLSSDTETYEKCHSSHRLLVKIDKICYKSESESKRLHSSCMIDKWKSTQNIQGNLTLSDQSSLNNSCQKNLNESTQKSSDKSNLKNEKSKTLETVLKSPEVLDICKNGCKLRDIIFSDSLAFMCENCGNIYLPQSLDINITKSTTQHKPSQTQVKNNLTCDICYSKFKIKLEYENHMRLHTCPNSETSFLCHICNISFETKPLIRQHILDVHVIGIKKENFKPTVNLQCKICNLTFKDEETLRNHISSHEENNNSALPLKQSVKFACAVCSMEFTTSAEIDAHVKNHREISVKDLTCNICKKSFQNDQMLSKHLRDHIAHFPKCHLCSKAFVNESILKRHLESHV